MGLLAFRDIDKIYLGWCLMVLFEHQRPTHFVQALCKGTMRHFNGLHNTLSLLWMQMYFASPITYMGWWNGLPEGWFAIDSWALFPISAYG